MVSFCRLAWGLYFIRGVYGGLRLRRNGPGGLDVAILVTAMNAVIALMFIGVGIKGDPMVFKFPGIYLALGTTALGVAGVLVS